MLLKRIGSILERIIIEGDNPVQVSFINISSILSSAEHEEFRVNLPGLSGKAKYFSETDSEPVP